MWIVYFVPKCNSKWDCCIEKSKKARAYIYSLCWTWQGERVAIITIHNKMKMKNASMIYKKKKFTVKQRESEKEKEKQTICCRKKGLDKRNNGNKECLQLSLLLSWINLFYLSQNELNKFWCVSVISSLWSHVMNGCYCFGLIWNFNCNFFLTNYSYLDSQKW